MAGVVFSRLFQSNSQKAQDQKRFDDLVAVVKGVLRISIVFFSSCLLGEARVVLTLYCLYEAYCVLDAIEEVRNYPFKVQTISDLFSVWTNAQLFNKLFDCSPFLKTIAILTRDRL